LKLKLFSINNEFTDFDINLERFLVENKARNPAETDETKDHIHVVVHIARSLVFGIKENEILVIIEAVNFNSLMDIMVNISNIVANEFTLGLAVAGSNASGELDVFDKFHSNKTHVVNALEVLNRVAIVDPLVVLERMSSSMCVNSSSSGTILSSHGNVMIVLNSNTDCGLSSFDQLNGRDRIIILHQTVSNNFLHFGLESEANKGQIEYQSKNGQPLTKGKG